MERKFRLTRSTEFQRVRREGRSYAHPLLVLVACQDADPASLRVGITASRAVGNAVQRNRAKRRIRACFQSFIPEIPPGWNLIVIARKPTLQANFDEIKKAAASLLKRAGLLVKPNGT